MTQYNITLDSEDVQGLFSSDEGLATLMEKVTDQILDQQATEQIGAQKYERSENRIGYRAGCRYFSLSPETGSEKVLKLMGKTANIRKVPGLIKKAASMGTSTCTFFVTGYPGETKEDRKQTKRYINHLARKGVDEVIMPILTPFPETEAMNEPSLQGFSEYDELCFSPVWRKDYKRLNRYRWGIYLNFYTTRLFFHPFRVLRQLRNVLTGKAATKSEMTARRIFMDLYDRFLRK